MSDELKHHGVLGQKWGVRRFQPYPSGYNGAGKFIGEDSEGNKITKGQYKKNKKQIKKDIKTARDLSNYIGSTLYRNDKIVEKKYRKANTYDKLEKARKYEKDVKNRKEIREKVNADLKNLLNIAEKDYHMTFNVKKYTPKENYRKATFAFARSNMPSTLMFGALASNTARVYKMNDLMRQYGYIK